MMDKRLTTRLTDYWNLLKKDSVLPEYSKFNNAAIADIWPSCFMLAVQPSTEKTRNYKYVSIGDKLVTLYGEDVTGNYVNSKQRHFKGAAIIKHVDKVTDGQEPLYDSGQFVNNKNKIVKFRSCLLPFGNHNGVTHVLAGLSWREF